MKSENKVKTPVLAATLVLSATVMLTVSVPALGHWAAGTTTVTFSDNPAALSGDSAPDVTITTTTTSAEHPEKVDDGRVTIQLATDGAGNPVPAGSVITWIALNAPGQNPAGGVTTLTVDLDALGFVCGTVGGFRAHYVTGGGAHKVETHFSVPVDLTAECECECEATETAFAYCDAPLGTCFLDIAELNANRWGWTIGPLAEGDYTFDIYADAGQCDIDNGLLVGQLHVSYAGGTATVTYDMDSCRILTETHLYIGSDILPVGEDGEYTVAPGQYGNIHDGEDAPNAESDQYVIEGLSGDIYLIAHAVVCVEPEAVDAQ